MNATSAAIHQREQFSRRDESRAVKIALKAAGIAAHVSHDTGTAYGWLVVRVTRPDNVPHIEAEAGHARNCPGCLWYTETRNAAIGIAQAVTGRHGDYEGQISFTT